MSTRVNLKDSTRKDVISGPDNWYKIVLADGRELSITPGLDGPRQQYAFVSVKGAGQGMVVRYQRYKNDNRLNQGWPIGEKGYLRCWQNVVGNMSVNVGSTIQETNLFVSSLEDYCYGLQAEQLDDGRVSLYAYDREGKLRGLRVGQQAVSLVSDVFPIGLDCAFVKVSNAISKGNF
ncbi:hypothetical protein F52700_549 [Fusarium sp. NRRL 52700]|nr:hypothetical protein F52700_549 [Fusarium sp. NRRL 52700]